MTTEGVVATRGRNGVCCVWKVGGVGVVILEIMSFSWKF